MAKRKQSTRKKVVVKKKVKLSLTPTAQRFYKDMMSGHSGLGHEPDYDDRYHRRIENAFYKDKITGDEFQMLEEVWYKKSGYGR